MRFDNLETTRLRLRPFTEADVDVLVALDSDPAVMHFITAGRPTDRTEIEQEVLPAFLRYDVSSGGYGFWAVERRLDGEFLGWIHLRSAPGHPRDEPELGYRLRQAAWGQGYACEGSRALLDLAFHELGARRVVAETMAVHTASRRVMEKTGLRLVRSFHADWPVSIPGDEHGDVEYALERSDWQQRRP